MTPEIIDQSGASLCSRKPIRVTQERSGLKSDASGVDVFNELSEDVRFKLFDDQGLVMIGRWLKTSNCVTNSGLNELKQGDIF